MKQKEQAMDVKTVKELMSAVQEVRRITELLLPLPKGMSPRHILIIDVIYQLAAENSEVKISDVSTKLQVTKPSVTKLVKELEQLGAVTKETDAADKRVTHLRLTALGLKYYDIYVAKYHKWLAKQLKNISKSDVRTTAATIHSLRQTLEGKQPEL